MIVFRANNVMRENDCQNSELSEYFIFKYSCVFYWEGTCGLVGVCLLWGWLFVYLAVPPAHLWQCCYLAWGLEDLSIINDAQTIPSWLFKHHFIHLQETHLLFTALPNRSLANRSLSFFLICTLFLFPATFYFWLHWGLRRMEGTVEQR